MSDTARPGGLTAMAILNFVFGALLLVASLGLASMLAMHEGALPGSGSDEMKGDMELIEKAGMPLVTTITALYGLTGLVQIVSGLGYLRMRRFLGRFLGNFYALLAISASLAWAIGTAEARRGGFDLQVVSNLVYPLITLVLINTTFRDDLVN
jgi:hypothetical protein